MPGVLTPVTRILAPALAALAALGGAAPSAAGAARLGIADSDATTFAETHWPGLGVGLGRAVVPYDVALTPAVAGTPAGNRRIEFDAWLANAAGARVKPLVSFQASLDPAKRTAAGIPLAPSRRTYATAVRAFLQTYPSVRTLSAWNEPNFRDRTVNPLRSKPRLAAAYYRTLAAACPSCMITAGELAGVPGDPYLRRYQRGLGSARPAVWSLTAHTDANRFQDGTDRSAPATRWYLAGLSGKWSRSRVWIDEIGAYFRDERGKIWGDGSEARTTRFILGLATLSRRIQRIYYYNLDNECSTASRCAVQDRGLVSPAPFDGTPLAYDTPGRVRPAYGVIQGRGPVIRPR